MIHALLDTDVVLDLVLAREPFVDDAATLWLAHEERHFVAYIAPITPIESFIVVRKVKRANVTRKAVNILIRSSPQQNF